MDSVNCLGSFGVFFVILNFSAPALCGLAMVLIGLALGITYCLDSRRSNRKCRTRFQGAGESIIGRGLTKPGRQDLRRLGGFAGATDGSIGLSGVAVGWNPANIEAMPAA
jgi:hypothetical protein